MAPKNRKPFERDRESSSARRSRARRSKEPSPDRRGRVRQDPDSPGPAPRGFSTRIAEDIPEAGQTWLYGIQPVVEALRGPEPRIEKIWIAYGRAGPGVERIRALAHGLGIPVSMRDRAALDLKAGTTKHQGMLALLKQVSGPDLETFLEAAARKEGTFRRFLALLDGVQDPHNLGAIIRTACAAGVEGLVLPKHGVCPVTPAVIKASAGAAHLLTLVQAGNASRALERIRAQGITVVGAEARAEQDLHHADFSRDLCLVIGGEGKGIRPGLRDLCDEFVSIPMAGPLDSLNVSVAAGILLFEVLRQRRH